MKRYILITVALVCLAFAGMSQDPYGKNGHTYISNSAAKVTGTWYCLQAVTQCITDTIRVLNQTGQYTYALQVRVHDTIPAGTFLFWNITTVQLISGKAVLYRKQD